MISECSSGRRIKIEISTFVGVKDTRGIGAPGEERSESRARRRNDDEIKEYSERGDESERRNVEKRGKGRVRDECRRHHRVFGECKCNLRK